MTKIPKAETYIVAGKNEIECRRCGKRLEFSLPMTVPQFADMVKKFNTEHAKCPKLTPIAGA